MHAYNYVVFCFYISKRFFIQLRCVTHLYSKTAIRCGLRAVPRNYFIAVPVMHETYGSLIKAQKVQVCDARAAQLINLSR